MNRIHCLVRVLVGTWFIVLLFALTAMHCPAEIFPAPVVAADKLPPPAAAQIQTQAQIHADEMFDFLQLKIDELNRVCRLTPQQQAKFTIAAKGAVDRALSKWVDASVETTQLQNAEAAKQQAAVPALPAAQARQVQGFFMGEVAGGVAVARAIGDGPVNLELPPMQLAQDVVIWNDGGNVNVNGNVQIQGGVFAIGGGGRVQQFTFSAPLDKAAVTRESVWQAAEKNVLTPEQSQAWSAAVAARAALPGATPADQVLAAIDSMLLLDPSQREKFFASVRPLVNARARVPGGGRQQQDSASLAIAVLRSRSADVMSDTLGEAQFNYWKTHIRPNEAAAAPARVNALNQGFFGGGPAAAPVDVFR